MGGLKQATTTPKGGNLAANIFSKKSSSGAPDLKKTTSAPEYFKKLVKTKPTTLNPDGPLSVVDEEAKTT